MQTLLWIALAQTDPAALVQDVVKAAGGREKLLTLFRIKERISVTADLEAKGAERSSVLQLPANWWLGKRNRVTEDKEPAAKLAWVWTLGALLDPTTKLERLPAAGGLDGLRLSGSIDPPMDVWFDAKEHRLAAIDWRKDRHVFSEWKEIDGLHYASRVVGHKPDGKVWYHTRILSVERLTEVPPELKR